MNSKNKKENFPSSEAQIDYLVVFLDKRLGIDVLCILPLVILNARSAILLLTCLWLLKPATITIEVMHTLQKFHSKLSEFYNWKVAGISLKVMDVAMVEIGPSQQYIMRSVNFKFIPEPVFVSKQFAISLLIAHLGLLAAFAHYKWCRHEGGLFKLLHSKVISALSSSSSSGLKILKEEHIMITLFAGNFIGIVCARSLHYQFYSWDEGKESGVIIKSCRELRKAMRCHRGL